MLVMLLMVLLMVLVVVLFSLQVYEVVQIWSLFVGWHHVFDESDADVLAE